MHVLISGSTGLVGEALVARLTQGGCQVTRLVRREAGADEVSWDPAGGRLSAEDLAGIDAVVHLAGENIAAGRWSDVRKARIRNSRVHGTRLLAETLAAMVEPPRVFLSASAIGFYGSRGDEIMSEASSAGAGFLAAVCGEWERAAEAAEEVDLRLAYLRFGVILSPAGGALQKMLTPFRMCAGGILGGGKQYMSWISLDDAVGAIVHALEGDSVRGPVNVVSPNAVTNREFTKTLGRVLGRPTILQVPGFVARIAFGEMADEMLLSSTRVAPTRLTETGYEFAHPQLESALRHVLG